MRVLVITSCTGTKAVSLPDHLTIDDFAEGPAQVAARERELPLTPAEAFYAGQQHLRLMAGVGRFRKAGGPRGDEVDLRIVSAGYGLVPGDRELAPYEATFTGMGKAAARAWAAALGIPTAVRIALAEPFDLALLLLGEAYLDAVELGPELALGGPTLVVTTGGRAAKLPAHPDLHPLPLGPSDPGRFGAGQVFLKGEVGGRALGLLADGHPPAALLGPPATVLDLLAAAPSTTASMAGPQSHAATRRVRAASVPNPDVDQVVDLPLSWRERTARSPLRYFIPDWDDRVDPHYDFVAERHAGGAPDWSNEAYAHQIYPEPAYDGILVSRATIDESAAKRRRVEDLGIHGFLRVPDEFPVMGDCGAFSYVGATDPPYSTDDVLRHYTELGFDRGVSVDHLLFVDDEVERCRRYQLTIANAEDFLREHEARSLEWTAMGAVQGWDPASYADAARQYTAMGYRSLALGGMVRSRDREILAVLSAVHDAVPAGTDLHLLGVARFRLIPEMVRLGITSADTASYLRSAWMSGTNNYLTADGWYTAIRIPVLTDAQAAAGSRRGRAAIERLQNIELDCLEGVADLRSGRHVDTRALARTLTEYSREHKELVRRLRNEARGHVAEDRPTVPPAVVERDADRIRRTLNDRPWETCGCEICDAIGVDVIIFRGNNRNRRRGFHNTHIFSRLLNGLLQGEPIPWLAPSETRPDQLAIALA